MSKSAGPAQGVIELTDAPEAIRQKTRSALTDSGREIRASARKPAITNLLNIYAALSNREVSELEESFAGASYEKFKNSLADLLIASLRPVRESYATRMADREELERVLREGAAGAKAVASRTLAEVYARLGLTF